MSINLWDWNNSNGTATKEETIQAHDAVLYRWETIKFSHKVWNDLVDKINEVHIDLTETNWNDSICTLNDTKLIEEEYIMTAEKFNSAVNNLDIIKNWVWISDLGRLLLKPGDTCKGEYFLALANGINKSIAATIPFSSVLYNECEINSTLSLLDMYDFDGSNIQTSDNFSIYSLAVLLDIIGVPETLITQSFGLTSEMLLLDPLSMEQSDNILTSDSANITYRNSEVLELVNTITANTFANLLLKSLSALTFTNIINVINYNDLIAGFKNYLSSTLSNTVTGSALITAGGEIEFEDIETTGSANVANNINLESISSLDALLRLISSIRQSYKAGPITIDPSSNSGLIVENYTTTTSATAAVWHLPIIVDRRLRIFDAYNAEIVGENLVIT